jgi:hypothetical protein
MLHRLPDQGVWRKMTHVPARRSERPAARRPKTRRAARLRTRRVAARLARMRRAARLRTRRVAVKGSRTRLAVGPLTVLATVRRTGLTVARRTSPWVASEPDLA